jgi:hypothetical protein
MYRFKGLVLTAAILAVPAAWALAQPTNPSGNQGSNRSVTATPGTSDSSTMSPMHTGDVGSSGSHAMPPPSMAATDPNKPGATGQTVVPGDNSTVAGTASATRTMQTGAQSK